MRKRLFLTWVTHGSRYSEKMKNLKVEKQEGYFLDRENRIAIYDLIVEKLKKEGIGEYCLNVLSDHVHLVCMYEENNLSELIRKIKGFVSFTYLRQAEVSSEGEGRQHKLWARGFSKTYLDTDEHYEKAIKYTLENHKRHEVEDITQLVNRGL